MLGAGLMVFAFFAAAAIALVSWSRRSEERSLEPTALSGALVLPALMSRDAVSSLTGAHRSAGLVIALVLTFVLSAPLILRSRGVSSRRLFQILAFQMLMAGVFLGFEGVALKLHSLERAAMLLPITAPFLSAFVSWILLGQRSEKPSEAQETA